VRRNEDAAVIKVYRVPLLLLMVALASAALLPGCSPIDVPNAKTAFGRAPELPEVAEKDETVRGENDPPVVTLKIGTALRERRLARGDDLPDDITLPTTNLQGVPVTAALEAVLAGTDIALSYQGNEYDDRTINLLNLSGPLPKVVERICSAARLFCNYRAGSLELRETDTFIIELPPMQSETAATSTISDTVKQLSGNEVQVDTEGGNLIYTANYDGYNKVSQYLEQLRNGRPLVVMQMNIWEVSLDDNNATGVNWTSFNQGGFGGSGQKVESITGSAANAVVNAISSGVSIGAVLRGQIDASLVAKFLATQGAVQTISNPQLTFVSGSNAKFVVGGKRRFVSQVGQLVSNSVSGSGSGSNGIGSNTVSTDEIDTGLTIDVRGSYEGGVIFATMDLTITDIIRVDSINTGSTQLQLPETSDRQLKTVLRVRPGDNLVLAGMTSSRDELKRDNFSLPLIGDLPMGASDVKQNRELVILLRPAIVLFADDKQLAEERKEERRRPLPEPVVIDAAGSRPITMESEPRTVSDQADESSAFAALSTPGNVARGGSNATQTINAGNQVALFGPTSGTPVGAPGPDVSLVDRGLLQRGFSYAFDELLVPMPATGAQP
jgi:Flp pilus assembly secretin CpaC